ncbi:RagB/SusD family nutrient uptake outer membrane protein [Mucilaginibacter hurinus]|uniref:RagB/SusD family nutrient uptake outer membrane protein n=1 Tax=Mucilaginibacter hurinus TaxID=2201324 RepID=A0A367GMU1_9SPHI|nr:RagB/SusD family nutrient uptake outer membrane protein [Mucilaginibacter hurinus]RCH54779.1 RagB/SusD family nutrient uptake outer membrane protein [Mucilaginibacter hurinus]
MKTNSIKIFFITGLFITSLVSCSKKLDLLPTNETTAEQVYSTPEGYKLAMAKVYASYATVGNGGNTSPYDRPDVQGIDEGTTDFFRLFWCLQELPTEEAVVGWPDAGLPDFHNMSWSSNNPFIKGFYYRSLYQITVANDFIRQAADDKISSRGISGADAEQIRLFRAEARFLRAYQYWALMDLFGRPPFADETFVVGGTELPKQLSSSETFAYVESELKALESLLADPRTNEYGRADKAAAWALLARMYLNAKTYTGTERNTDAATYAKKVIDAGYTLLPNYQNLLLADNNIHAKDEFILTINYDGQFTQGPGGTTFLTHAAVAYPGVAQSPIYGVREGWGGLRTTKNLVQLFPGNGDDTDKRGQFYTEGQNLEINDISIFADGYAVQKFRNVRLAGGAGSSLEFADIDMPIFRLAEMHLIYAEAVTRGGSGDASLALTYFNALRQRAYGNNSGNVTSLTLDLLLEERGRELYWEGFRRTDLIRFGKFTGDNYVWPWKGGVKAGRGVSDIYKLYPLPVADVTANSNLTQNPGY